MSSQDQPSANSRFRSLTPLAIFILSLLVRLYFWPAGLFHTDSVIAAQAAEATVAEGKMHYLQGAMGYPGYSLFVSFVFYAWHVLTGAESAEKILVFSSVLLGSVLPVLVFFFVQRLSGRFYAALYSSVSFSFFPLCLSLSTYVKDQMLWGCLLVTAFYFAHSVGKGGGIRDKALAWGFFCAALITRQQAVIIAPAFLVMYVGEGLNLELKGSKPTFRIGREFTRDIAVGATALALLFIVAFVPKAGQDSGFSIWRDFIENSFDKLMSIRPFSQSFTDVSLPWLIQSMGAPASLLAVFGAFYTRRQGGFAWASMLIWVVSTVFLIGHVRYISPYVLFDALIPSSVFIGWGLSLIGERHQLLANFIVAVSCVWMLASAAPVLDFRSSVCGPCYFAKSIANVTAENSLVLAGDEGPHTLYYGGRNSPPPAPDPMDSEAMDRYLDSLEPILGKGAGIYITDSGWANDVRPSDLFSINMNERLIFRTDNGRKYANLEVVVMEPITVRDRQTGFTYPVGGVFMLEVLNRFQVLRVASLENENFHRTDLELQQYKSTLYRIQSRNNTAYQPAAKRA